MSWNLFAGCVELVGNVALVSVLVYVGLSPWPNQSLKRLAIALSIYSLTNVFYATAYIGRVTETWNWWGTAFEKTVLNIQVFSMWALLVTGIEALVDANEQ
jgi:hypothetical protein